MTELEDIIKAHLLVGDVAFNVFLPETVPTVSAGTIVWEPIAQVAMLGAAESVARFFSAVRGPDGQLGKLRARAAGDASPVAPGGITVAHWHLASGVALVSDVPPVTHIPRTAFVSALAQALTGAPIPEVR